MSDTKAENVQMVPKACEECGRAPTVLRKRHLVAGLFPVVASSVECIPCARSKEVWHDTEAAAIAAWNRRTPTGATP